MTVITSLTPTLFLPRNSYYRSELPILNQYVNFLSRKGPRFFVTDRIAEEFNLGPLPQVFHKFSHPDAISRTDRAYETVLAKFKVTSRKCETDVKWLLESGFCLHACESIPVESLIVSGKAFGLTMNAKLVHRFLRIPPHRADFEQIVDMHALEHLADVRLLHTHGSFEDLSAFD